MSDRNGNPNKVQSIERTFGNESVQAGAREALCAEAWQWNSTPRGDQNCTMGDTSPAGNGRTQNANTRGADVTPRFHMPDKPDVQQGNSSERINPVLPALRSGWGPYQALKELVNRGELNISDSELVSEARRIRDREFRDNPGKTYFNRGEQLRLYSDEEIAKGINQKSAEHQRPAKHHGPAEHQRPAPEHQKGGTERPPRREQVPQDGTGSDTAHNLFDKAGKEARFRTGQMIPTSKGVYLKSDFDVDVDGAPGAKRMDRFGSSKTSMRYADKGSINALEVPYIVLPGGKYQQFGISLGDYALVRDTKTGRVAAAVFADVGPRHKTGEGSLNLGRNQLGLPVNPNVGVSDRRFEYLVFPGSSRGRPRTQAELLRNIEEFRRRV